MLDLGLTAYTLRLEHVAGADLQIDAMGIHLETGTVLATWGFVKSAYE